MNIYFILEYVSGRGGVETVVALMTREFVSQGHTPVVFLPRASEDPTWESQLPSVIYYHENESTFTHEMQFLTNRAIALQKAMLQIAKPHILVGTHVPQTTLYARLIAGYQTDIEVISWLHNPPKLFRDYQLIQYADKHWAISHSIAREIGEISSYSQPITWVGNPMVSSNTRVNFPSDIARFLYIGRIENQQKRIDLLLNGLTMVQHPWILDVYGDGPDLMKLKELSVHLQIDQNILWHGWIENPWYNIEQATALVLTSAFEGFGMVIVEAMSHGVPVISSICGGPEDIIEDRETGLLYDVYNLEQLKDCLNEAAVMPAQLWSKMSQAAIDRSKLFSPDQVFRRILPDITKRENRGE